jgi:hypothetical protein
VNAVTVDYLRRHWGTAYEFSTTAAGAVTAQPRHAGNQPLSAPTPAELLALIRRHYQSPPPLGVPPAHELL